MTLFDQFFSHHMRAFKFPIILEETKKSLHEKYVSGVKMNVQISFYGKIASKERIHFLIMILIFGKE